MADYNTLPVGLKIGTQLPLDARTRSPSEASLKDLGEFNQLAYTYAEGLNVRCILEGTSYTWREVKSIELTPGLLPVAFTYPVGITAGGIIYDNRSFNFFGERLITAAEINKLNSLVNGGGSGGSGNGTDTFISSGTFSNGTLSLINNLGGSINITGFSAGSTGGGDQSLQSVLENGSEVTYDNFNSNAQLFGGIPNNRSTYINHGNSLQSSGIDLSNSRFKATSNLNSGKFSSLTLANGIIELQQDDFTASPLKSTIVNMVTPVANTLLRFPAKSIGTYTLATLSDIPAPQDISGKQNILTLTNFGTSGNATLTGSVLNIPNYAGGTGGTGGGTVVNLSATNGTGQTFTITNPTTTPNITLTLTKAAVGLGNVPNTDFTNAVSENTSKISFDNVNATRLANTSGTNTGDQDISGKVDKVTGERLISANEITKLGNQSGSNSGDQIIPTTLPASDVYAWAKTTVKPLYTTAEVNDVTDKRYVTDAEKTKITNAVSSTGNTVYTGVSSYTVITIGTATANTIAWTGSDSNLYRITLSKDSVLSNPTAPITGAVYQFIILQNGTGLWSLSYGNMFKWPDGAAPVIDANANSKGILTALYDGTVLLVVSIQNFL
jgi:hypothetical protein